MQWGTRVCLPHCDRTNSVTTADVHRVFHVLDSTKGGDVVKRAVSCRMEVLLDRVRLQRLGLLLVILSMAGFAACYTRKAYRGDGKIFAVKVGNFFLGCTWYKVSLGPIDLATKNTKVFTMQGLPHKEMCL